MGKLLDFFRRPIVIELEQINCQAGDTVFMATRHILSAKARKETAAKLAEIAEARGVKFAVFDGVCFFVVSAGAGSSPDAFADATVYDPLKGIISMSPDVERNWHGEPINSSASCPATPANDVSQFSGSQHEAGSGLCPCRSLA